MQSLANVLAVDIGGTKVAVARVAPDGRILAQRQAPTCQDGPAAGIRQIIDLLETVHDPSAPVAGIGVGIPAVLEADSDRVIWAPNLAGWRDVALRPALEQHFHLPVCIEYDGHTAVLGEWWLGAGRGCRSVVDVIIGTGVGGGMLLDGRLIRGMNRLAGAVGWFVLNGEPGGETQQERSLGCWEARTAGPGIARRAQTLLAGGQWPASALAALAQPVTARDVFAAAQQGDELAGRVADETADLLGMGIANIVSLVNPEIVVLGGSVGAHAGFLIPRMTAVVARYAQPVSAQTVRILASTLGPEAGLLGAACGLLLRVSNTFELLPQEER